MYVGVKYMRDQEIAFRIFLCFLCVFLLRCVTDDDDDDDDDGDECGM